MLCVLVTAPNMGESRITQDRFVDLLGEESVAPIMWVVFVGVRTPLTLTAFSNRYVGKLADSEYDFVLCDDPLEEAMRRAR